MSMIEIEEPITQNSKHEHHHWKWKISHGKWLTSDSALHTSQEINVRQTFIGLFQISPLLVKYFNTMFRLLKIYRFYGLKSLIVHLYGKPVTFYI